MPRMLASFVPLESGMGRFIDRTGQRFGRLVVVEKVGVDHAKKIVWKCKCDCGKDVNVVAGSLVTGNTTSCGCFLKERVTKHGGSRKASYNTWRAMMRRCYVKTDKDYPKYGAMGITVCQQWHEYVQFARDVGEPVTDQTLDRIDPYGNYEPNNCRWASLTVQNRNVRMSKRNKSGIKGVLNVGGRWYAQITAKRAVYRSKSFDTPEEAAVARKELEKTYWEPA